MENNPAVTSEDIYLFWAIRNGIPTISPLSIAAHTRAAVERETAQLRAENDRLTKSFMDLGAGRVTLEELAVSNGRLTAVAGGEIVQLMAEQLYKFMKDGGAINYMESQFSPKDATKGRIIVNCRWETGKTPHELRTEAEAKLTAAEATVAAKDVELAVIKKQRDDLLFLNDAYRRATPQAELATLRTRLDTAREALEKTHAAFKHWEGEPVSTGHYNELIWAKEAVAAALSSIREGEKPS